MREFPLRCGQWHLVLRSPRVSYPAMLLSLGDAKSGWTRDGGGSGGGGLVMVVWG